MSEAWEIRRPRAADGHFIVDSWRKSYNEQICHLDREAGYWDAQKLLIVALLERSVVGVACLASDADQILGWGAGEPGSVLRLHYVYVKKKYRERGVANAIITHLRAEHPEGDVVCSHEGCSWARRKAKSRGWGHSPKGVLYRMILDLHRGG